MTPGSGPARNPTPWRRLLPVVLLGLLVAGLVVGAKLGLPGEVDPGRPFLVGSDWGLAEALAQRGSPVTAHAEIGYDGQWFLGHAYDPLVRSDLVTTFDRPQYRAFRPAYPMAGWLLGAGQPGLIPYALLLVSVLAVGIGCAATARVATAYGRSRWWGLLFAAIPGVLVGLSYGTAEPLGVGLAALGLSLALVDRRYGWAGLAFAGAALTKETYLAFGVMVAVHLAVEARFRGWSWFARGLLVAGPGVAALVGWWTYVSVTVPESQRTPNHLLDLPFAGWARVFGRIVSGDYTPYPISGPVLLTASFGVLVAALVLALRRLAPVGGWRAWSPPPLAWQALLWAGFGLSLVHIMLERFLSAQRVLAPAVFAAALFLITAWPARRADPAAAVPVGPSAPAGPSDSVGPSAPAPASPPSADGRPEPDPAPVTPRGSGR